MIAITPFLIATAVWFFLIVFPLIALCRHQPVTWWDYVYPFVGIPVWFGLTMVRVGATASLANFVVEVFWIAVAAVVVPWARWILTWTGRARFKRVSMGLAFLPVIVAVTIRLFMPTLPE